jgi:hypothetical protein
LPKPAIENSFKNSDQDPPITQTHYEHFPKANSTLIQFFLTSELLWREANTLPSSSSPTFHSEMPPDSHSQQYHTQQQHGDQPQPHPQLTPQPRPVVAVDGASLLACQTPLSVMALFASSTEHPFEQIACTVDNGQNYWSSAPQASGS